MKVVVGTSTGVDQQGRYFVHYPSRWTSTVDRNPFYFYPFEVGYASTLLKRDTHCDVKMIDAGLQALDRHAYAQALEAEGPDVVVIESATRCFPDDLAVLQRVKASTGCVVVLVGQHAAAFEEEARTIADHVIPGEYESALLELIRALQDAHEPPGLPERRRFVEVDELSWPEDEDVSRLDYVGPLPGHRYRQIHMYASRGCPMRCDYCVAVHVYYESPNWRRRDPDDVLAEMVHLEHKYRGRFDGFFFDEEVHFLNKRFILELCEKMIAADLGHLRHTAMGTYFSLDEEMLTAMHAAGYRQLKLGIETASANIAEQMGLGKKHDLDKLREVLRIARDLGLESYGNFVVGANGSSYAADMETAGLVRELLSEGLLHEMQVSICTPQPGTPFFTWCTENGYLMPVDWSAFDGLLGSVVSYPHYTKAQIEEVFCTINDIGHHVRGMRDLRTEGVLPTVRRAVERVGLRGLLGHLRRYYASPWQRRLRQKAT